ncbi:MAG: response regulator, partial [Bacteroidales bacterium]|nr:response regulator [Bacteroidales bacterium]
GFLRFNPKAFYSEREEASAMVTVLKVNGSVIFPEQRVEGKVLTESVMLNDQKLILPSRKNNLTLEFSSFDYTSMDQVQYSCFLEGYDQNWRILEPGSNSIEYMNLPPGKYTFSMKPLLRGKPGKITTFEVEILKPLWLRWPFLLIYGVLILTIGYLIFRQYHRGMRFKAQMDLIQLEQEKNEQLSNSKIRFYVNISHELLTSIGLIIDPVRNLLKKSEIRETTRNTLELVDRNAQFLKVYIDQLLNFRKLETGHQVDLNENEIELVSFAKQTISFFRNRALAKGVTLKLKSEFRQLNLVADEEKLYSILQNLLSNAIKYTPAGGHVRLSLRHFPDNRIAIEVKDNGIGIPESEQEKIFERFYQILHGNTASGTGIGLTIAKDFIEIMGGSVEVESSPGSGALFRVFLPAHKARLVSSEPYVKEYVTDEVLKTEKHGMRLKLKQDSSLPQVVLVDQSEDVYLYLASSLQNKYNFLWAGSGGEALELVKNTHPDIIISEIQLPDIDGIEFCREVRNNPKTARIPVIFLTVKSETENQLKAIEAGVDIFLPKPLEIAVLDANLVNLLRRSERTREFINRRLLISAKEVRVDSRDDKILKEVVEYIHAHITETNISSHDISYAVGVSHSSLYRKIKKLTGNSLNEFIRYVRLQKAEQLLSGGNYTIAEIMDQVGFTNHSYFAKCFRNQFGLSPREYQAK